MKELFKCRGCGAVYRPIQPDNTVYAHVCGPLLDEDTDEFVLRKGHRDENIRVDRLTGRHSVTSEGAGVVPVKPTTVSEPTWLARFKRTNPPEED
jgi:hypothetical protein